MISQASGCHQLTNYFFFKQDQYLGQITSGCWALDLSIKGCITGCPAWMLGLKDGLGLPASVPEGTARLEFILEAYLEVGALPWQPLSVLRKGGGAGAGKRSLFSALAVSPF